MADTTYKLDSNGNDITPGIGSNLNKLWGGIKSFGSNIAGGASMIGDYFKNYQTKAGDSAPADQFFRDAASGFTGLFSAPTTPNGNIPNPITPKPVAVPASTTSSQIKSSVTTSPAVSSVTDTSLPMTKSYDTTLGNAAYNDAPFSINTVGSTSQSLSGGITPNDVLTRRQQMENQYMQAYQDYAAANTAERQGQMTDLAREQNALYSGDTTDFGLGLSGLVKNQDIIKQAGRAIQTQGALLQTQGMSNMLGFMNQDIQNQLATVPNLQNVQQAADGSIIGFIRDPLTGQIQSQNFGNPLLGTFSGQGQTGAQIGGGSSQQSLDSNAGTISLPANGDGTYQTPSGGNVNQYYAQQISKMDPQYQNYVLPGPQGTAYIDGSRISQLPSQIQMQIQKEAAANGIPFLDQSQAAGVQSVYSLYDTLGLMQQLVDKTLSSGTAGHAIDWAKSTLNSIFQNQPELQNFNNLRTLAGQADTNLMGGIGSGFRQNTANLSLSVQNLPVATDSLETANAKIQATRALLDQSMLKTFPGFKGTGSITSNGAAVPAQNQTYVQTKAGAIPTNW